MIFKNYGIIIEPDYSDKNGFNRYANDILLEYQQCIEEGLDVKEYKEFFEESASLDNGEKKNTRSDEIFSIVINADLREDYEYTEPSDIQRIRELRNEYKVKGNLPDTVLLKRKIRGAWLGRAVGCLLGKPLEGIRSDELIPFLKESDNYPMYRYVLSKDITEEIHKKYKFWFHDKPYADTVDGMPVDDDTNYVVLAQKIIDDYGRDFCSDDVAQSWLKYQSVYSYFTAERIAYVNFINCLKPPASAVYKNVCREWIGAQIRGDYYGYINPGDPETAAEMAYKDARISHVKNGIYGEMFVSAMIAAAAVTDSIEDIILCGLGQIPYSSRLYEAVSKILSDYKNGVSLDKCFEYIHSQYDEHTDHGWCHTISNAMIVTAALLYGEGDFGKSICCAVGMAFDTDCNGATVGSILGMRGTDSCIDEVWSKPVNNKIHTSIFGVGTVDIDKAVEHTLEHII